MLFFAAVLAEDQAAVRQTFMYSVIQLLDKQCFLNNHMLYIGTLYEIWGMSCLAYHDGIMGMFSTLHAASIDILK